MVHSGNPTKTQKGLQHQHRDSLFMKSSLAAARDRKRDVDAEKGLCFGGRAFESDYVGSLHVV